MAIVCWIVFFALLILAFVRKTNMGFLAFGAALILGHIIGMRLIRRSLRHSASPYSLPLPVSRCSSRR